MFCGLHFIVCSDYLGWPIVGEQEEFQCFCPECGNDGPKVHWVEVIEGFIFQAVPGNNSELVNIE